MYKSKLFMFLVLSVVIAIGGFTGCSSKKKTSEPAKQVEKAPEAKPTPPAITPKSQEKAESVVPSNLTFQTIYFDYDKSSINDNQRSAMEKNAQLLSRYKSVKIRIEGHCDERGTEEYNQALGQRRADAVKNYLSNYGISIYRINTVSYGEMKPVNQNHNEAAWSKNRRCEIIITAR